MKRVVGSIVLAVLALGLVSVSSAAAKSPPKGTYECTIAGLFADDMKITGKDTYKRFDKKGKYKAGKAKTTFDDGIVGYKINFKTGAFECFKGRWYKVDSGAIEIALKNPINGAEDTYCDKD
jgi:hypothetical protein